MPFERPVMGTKRTGVSGTVLVVEDNLINMKLTKGLLNLLDCRVLEAEDAETGLEILKTEDVDLLLLDIHLPGMDGIAACRVIRQDLGRTALPIIAVSALAMKEDIEAAMRAGFDEYITKPVRTKQFLEVVSGWLSGEVKRAAPKSVAAPAREDLKNVLVVDDSKTNVRLLKSMLPDDLYEVTEAYSGQEALDVVAASQPDVIFLDIMMPDLDGYEVTRRLKSDPETDHIPIVLVTALEGMDERVQGFELGAEDVLVKPVRKAEVISRARSMVRLSEYQKQLNIRDQAAETFSIGTLDEEKKRVRKRPSVLLVEDSKQDAHVFLVNFGTGEFDIEVAMDGKQALRHLEEKEFDLILLDLVLPDMDGLEILTRAKGIEYSKRPQVVIVTALNDLETRLKGIEHGADDYLIKPVHPRELQVRIEVLLRKKTFMDNLRDDSRDSLSSAMKDRLTGVYNKAYLDRYIELEMKRSKRHQYPVSLVRVAIDNFRDYNVQLGYLVGDLVLRDVASILKNTFREIDLIARLDGDEFAVILPYCSARTTDEAVDRACDAVFTHPFPTEQDLVPGSVSISTGAATHPGEASTAEELMKLAEEALSQEKAGKKEKIDIEQKEM